MVPRARNALCVANIYTNTNRNCDRNADSYANTYTECYTNSYGHVHSDEHSNSYRETHTITAGSPDAGASSVKARYQRSERNSQLFRIHAIRPIASMVA